MKRERYANCPACSAFVSLDALGRFKDHAIADSPRRIRCRGAGHRPNRIELNDYARS